MIWMRKGLMLRNGLNCVMSEHNMSSLENLRMSLFEREKINFIKELILYKNRCIIGYKYFLAKKYK